MLIERDLCACMWGEIPYTETKDSKMDSVGLPMYFSLFCLIRKGGK